MSNSKTVSWRNHKSLLDTFRELRLYISHAYFGQNSSFYGSDRILENRIYYCLDDCGEIHWTDIAGKKQTLYLYADSITFIPGSIDLTYNFETGQMIAFHYNLEIFPGLDIFHDQNRCQQLQHKQKDCKDMYTIMHKDSSTGSVFQIQGQLMIAMASFFQTDLNSLKKQVILQEKYSSFLSILSIHLNAALTISELSDRLGLSRDQLSKAFRRDMGVSLKYYLNHRLIRKASALLSGAMNVKETAAKLRFSSEFYFSRFFQKHSGITPSKYRKQFMVED